MNPTLIRSTTTSSPLELLFVFSLKSDFEQVYVRRGQSERVCVCVCVHRKRFLGTVTTSDMIMHHVLIILAMAFIQGRIDLNHENNKCTIISENVQAINAYHVCFEDSSTEGLYNLLSVR